MKKPNFIKRWITKIVRETLDYNTRDEQPCLSVPVSDNSIPRDLEKSINFTVHHAAGGRVVELRRYDQRKGENVTRLYIITEDKEFGNEIDKIVTMELLR